MIEAIIVAFFLTFLAYREWTHEQVVSDLHRKLMAKSIGEYKAISDVDTKPRSSKPKPKDEDKLVDAFDVDPKRHFAGEYKTQSPIAKLGKKIGLKK